MEHSPFSPSKLSRIIGCPGSVNLIKALIIDNRIVKEKASSYAEHGTMLHEVMKNYETEGKEALNGLSIDDKYLVNECIDYMDMLIKSKSHSLLSIRQESKVALDKWGIPEVWGTLDLSIYDQLTEHLDVVDWKFGSGVSVYAKENPQLMAYAAGAASAIGLPTKNITLHIVQPAIDNYSTWTLTMSELYKWVHGVLAIAINDAKEDCCGFNPGVETCRWCEAQNHCRVRLNNAIKNAAAIFETADKLAECPSYDELAKMLKLAPLVEKAIKDIRLYAQNEMMNGNDFPGFKLVAGRANRRWKDEKKVIDWLSTNTDIDEIFNSKIKSPSQIEKEDRTLKKNKEFNDLFETPSGKVTLAPENDKRSAIETKTAVDVFADYQAPDKLE